MAPWSNASPHIVDVMETALAARPPNPLKDKVIHADIQIQSIESTSARERQGSGDSRLIEDSALSPEDVAYHKQAAEMQLWWDEAIAKNMDLPDGYLKVAVLLVKWDDELDELHTREEAEELEAVFRDLFHFRTEIVELNISSKPQHQMNRYLSAFVEKHDGPNNLLIVYYTGHGVYREDHKHLELTASRNPLETKGFTREARLNWNKAEEILRSDDVECDVLTILDTCYSSNLAKSAKEENRTFELLSACGIDQTTAAPGDYSFTRALIDALKELLERFGERPFTTFHLNERILRDERRHDTPSQLWVRLEHNGRHVRLAPLKPGLDRHPSNPGLQHLPRGYLTLRFGLRYDSLNREQIINLTRTLSKALSNKEFFGLRRIDWLGIKPARTTHFGRAALAMFAIAQWKRFLKRRREEKLSQKHIDEVRFPVNMTEDESPMSSPTRKRTHDFHDTLEPEPKRGHLVIPQPPSPPISDSSRIEDPQPNAII